MLKNFLLVGIGGAAGSMLRYAFSWWFKNASFPLGTFLVNIIGCFIIGAAFAFAMRNEHFDVNWRLFVVTGICGGFTTYSAFSVEMLTMLQQNKYALFIIYFSATVILGLLATWFGYALMK
ncbi:MAG: fluoride efflux transporter CrcB [Lacibacter sp.]